MARELSGSSFFHLVRAGSAESFSEGAISKSMEIEIPMWRK
jgi:hypothetical protein